MARGCGQLEGISGPFDHLAELWLHSSTSCPTGIVASGVDK